MTHDENEYCPECRDIVTYKDEGRECPSCGWNDYEDE